MLALLTRAYSIAPLVLLIAAMGWAGNAIAGRMAVGEISPMLLIFTRWVIVVAIMLSFRGKAMVEAWPVMRPRLLWVITMGACGFSVFNGLFYVSAHSTTAINLGLIQATLPAMVLIGSFFIFGTRIGYIQIIGLIVSFTGVMVIVGQGSLAALLGLQFNFGDILMVITCAFYSAYALGLKNRPQVDAMILFGYLATAALFISIPMVLVEHIFWGLLLPGLTGWLIIAFTVLWPSLLSQIFFMRGVDLIGPGRAGLYANTVPVMAPLFAIIILGEQFHTYHILAMLMVFAGIYIFEKTKRQE